MINLTIIKQTNLSFLLADGFFDSTDPSFNTKISTYLDLIQIHGFKASRIAMDIELLDKDSKKKFKADLLVYNNALRPQLIFQVKTPKDYQEYISQSFKTDLFNLAKLSVHSVKYLVLVYRNVSGYIDQKEVVVIDYSRYKSFESWKQSGFEHLDFLPVFES